MTESYRETLTLLKQAYDAIRVPAPYLGLNPTDEQLSDPDYWPPEYGEDDWHNRILYRYQTHGYNVAYELCNDLDCTNHVEYITMLESMHCGRGAT